MKRRARLNSRDGASMVKLLAVVLAAPVITFGLVSGLVLFFRGLDGSGTPAFAPPPAQARAEFKPVRPVPDKVAPKLHKPSAKSGVPASGAPEPAAVAAAPPRPPPATVGTPPAPVAAAEPPPKVVEPAVEPPAVIEPDAPPLAIETPVVAAPVPAPASAPVPPLPSAPAVVSTPAVVSAPPPQPTAPASVPVASPAPAVFQPGDETWLIEDFEQDPTATWKAASWGNPALITGVDGALKVEMLEGKADKVAIGRSIRLDMTSRGRWVMDVMNNTQRRLDLAVAFIGGEGSRFFESPGLSIKPGLNADVTFDLKARTFKCAESEWKHNKSLENAPAIKQFYILLYGRGAGEVFLDNVRAVSGEAGKAPVRAENP